MSRKTMIRVVVCVLAAAVGLGTLAATAQDKDARKPVAALVADWFPRSHPDVIFKRVLATYSLDGKGEPSKLRIVSMYRDKPGEKDMGAALAKQYDFKIVNGVADALTLGTGKLAVEGVLLSTEWASYPESPTGAIMYPHRQMFAEIVKVFQASGRVVPVFIDKHLADTWDDSKWIYDTAKEMKIPLMAGSSLPVSWRRPAVDVRKDAPLKEIVGVSYHTLTGYGFHGLEMTQTLAERRKGGETGVKSVQCLTGKAVWDAEGKLYDKELLDAAMARTGKKLPEGKTLRDVVAEPTLFVIDYYDGLRVNVFTLNFFVTQWSAAWRYADDNKVESTLFALQEEPPFNHFAAQMKGVEEMILTGKPTWPVERTLLTSGILDAALISKKDGGKKIDTPYLKLSYTCDWPWRQPVDPASQPAAK